MTLLHRATGGIKSGWARFHWSDSSMSKSIVLCQKNLDRFCSISRNLLMVSDVDSGFDGLLASYWLSLAKIQATGRMQSPS